MKIINYIGFTKMNHWLEIQTNTKKNLNEQIHTSTSKSREAFWKTHIECPDALGVTLETDNLAINFSFDIILPRWEKKAH